MYQHMIGAAVAEWLSSWLAEQEDRGSIPGLATWIFRDWLSPASKSWYSWNTVESDVNPQYNQPNQHIVYYVYIPSLVVIYILYIWNKPDDAFDLGCSYFTQTFWLRIRLFRQ